MAWTYSAANGPGSLVFTDDVNNGRSSRMNPEVNRSELSDQIQPNAAELTGRSFTVQMDNDPQACFSLPEDKTEDRKTHKQAATEGSCSKILEKHLVTSMVPDSDSH